MKGVRVAVIGFSLMLANVSQASYEDGVQAGQTALAGVSTPAITVDLEAFMNQTDESLIDPRFANKSAQTIGNQSQGAGNAVTESLQQEMLAADRQGRTIDLEAQRSFKDKGSDERTLSETLQHIVINQETLNATDRDGEPLPAFAELMAIERGEKAVELALDNQPTEFTQQGYEEVIETQELDEPYTMSCSTSLLPTGRVLEDNLHIDFSESYEVEKTLNVYQSVHSYQGHTISVDLKTGDMNTGNRLHSASKVTNPINEIAPGGEVISLIHTYSNWWNSYTHEVYSTYQQWPSASNGFVLTHHIDQGAMGRKKARHNGHKWRGRQDTWQVKVRVPAKLIQETWVKDPQTDLYQDLVDMGICQVTQEAFLEPGEKVFGVRNPKLKLNRPYWKKRITYQCDVPQGEDDCGQIPGECVEDETKREYITFLDQPAVEVKTFNCLKRKRVNVRHRVPKPPQLKDPKDYTQNNDFGDAAVALNFAKEMKDAFRKEAQGDEGLFFKGDDRICNLTKGCCVDKDSGWTKVFHCSEQEKQLAQRNQAKACTMVGEFQPKKGLLRKVKKIKKVSYCCYGSPLGRIIQEGAHQQIGISYGRAEAPQCRALTQDELRQLQFDRPEFDFSDLINEVKGKAMQTGFSQERLESVTAQLQAGIKNDTAEKLDGGIETTSNRKNLSLMLPEGDFSEEGVSQMQLMQAQQERIDQSLADKQLENLR